MSRFGNLEFNEEFGQSSESKLGDELFHLESARQAFERGEFEQALRSFAKVLEFNPQNTTAWCGQARMLIELGEFAEAKTWADKALDRFPSDAELLAVKAVALARLGDTKAALAFSDASVDAQVDSAYLWLARGDVLMARNEKRADYCFEKAQLLAPGDWLVRWLASRIHYYYEKFAVALKLAHQALALDAAQAAVWLQIGRCQEALGIIDLAQSSYRQSLQLSPHYRAAEQALMNLPSPGFLGSIRSGWKRLFLK